MTTLIGVMGPAGAGKSAVADYLIRNYGAKRYSFAAPLKELAMRTLDFTREQVWGTQAQKEAEDPRYGFSPRWFLQRLGTEGCRKVFGEDFWIRHLVGANGIIAREAPSIAVIDDCRFENEALAIRASGGRVWRLESPDRETSADSQHASEREWATAPCDAVLRPECRGLDLLFKLVDEAMQKAFVRDLDQEIRVGFRTVRDQGVQT